MDTRLSRSMPSLWMPATLLGFPPRRSRPRRPHRPRHYYINGVRTTLIGADSYPNPTRSPQRLILCGAGPRGENCFKETRASSTEELSRSAVFRCIRDSSQGERGRARRAVSCEDVHRTSTLSLPGPANRDSRLTESCEDVHRTSTLSLPACNRDSRLTESCEDVHRSAALSVHSWDRDPRRSESCEDVRRTATLSLPTWDRGVLSKSCEDVHRTAAMSVPTWDRDSRLSESGVSLSDSRTDLVSGAGLEEEEEDRVSQCSFGSSSAFHDMTMDSVSEADRLESDGHISCGLQPRVEGEARDRARGRTSGGRRDRERWRSEVTTSSSGRSSPSEDRKGFYHSTPTKRGSPVLAVFPGDEEDLHFPSTLPMDHLHGDGLHRDDLHGDSLHGPLSPSSKSEEHFLCQGSPSHGSKEGVLRPDGVSRDSHAEQRVLFPSSITQESIHEPLDQNSEENVLFISGMPRDTLSGSVNENSQGSSPSSPDHSSTGSHHGAFLPYRQRLTDGLRGQPSVDHPDRELGIEPSPPSPPRLTSGGDSGDTEARRQTAVLREAMRKRRQQFFTALHDCCQQEERSAEESVQSWLTTGHVQFTEDVVDLMPLTTKQSGDQKERICLDQPPDPVDRDLAIVQGGAKAVQQTSRQLKSSAGDGDEIATTGSLLGTGDAEEESERDSALLAQENKVSISLERGTTSAHVHTGPEVSSFTRSPPAPPSEDGEDVFAQATDASHRADVKRQAGGDSTFSTTGAGRMVVGSDGERLERQLSFGDDEGDSCFHTALHGDLASSSVPEAGFDRAPCAVQHRSAGDGTESKSDTQGRPQDLTPTAVSSLARSVKDGSSSTEWTADVLPDALLDQALPAKRTGQETPVLYHARVIQILPPGAGTEEASGEMSHREHSCDGSPSSLDMNLQHEHHLASSAVTGDGDVRYPSAATAVRHRQRDGEDSAPFDTKAEQSLGSSSPVLTDSGDFSLSSACTLHTGHLDRHRHSTERVISSDLGTTENEIVPSDVSKERGAFTPDSLQHHRDEDMVRDVQCDQHSLPGEHHSEERSFDTESGSVHDVIPVNARSGQRVSVSDVTAMETNGLCRSDTATAASKAQSRPGVKEERLSPGGGGCLTGADTWREEVCQELTAVTCLPSLQVQAEVVTSAHASNHSGDYPQDHLAHFVACDGGGGGVDNVDNGGDVGVDVVVGSIPSFRTSLAPCSDSEYSHSTQPCDPSERSSWPASPATRPMAKEKPALHKKATFTLAASTAGKTRTPASRTPWNAQWVHDKLLLFQRLLHDFESKTSQHKLLQGLVSLTADSSSAGGGGNEERMKAYNEACEDLYRAFTREFLEVRQNQACPLLEDQLPALRFQRYLRKRHNSRVRGQRRLRVRHSLHRVLELPRDSVFFSDTDSGRSVSTPLLPHHLLPLSLPATTRLNSDVFTDDADVSWSFSDSAYSTLSGVSSRQLSDMDSTLTSIGGGCGGSESVDCSGDRRGAAQGDVLDQEGDWPGDDRVWLDESGVDEALLDRLRVCHSKASPPVSMSQSAAVPVPACLSVAWRSV